MTLSPVGNRAGFAELRYTGFYFTCDVFIGSINRPSRSSAENIAVLRHDGCGYQPAFTRAQKQRQ